MKLVSIINAWVDAIELLPYCLKNHLEFCDHVIVVWSIKSNHGHYDDSMLKFICGYPNDGRVTFHQLEPLYKQLPRVNETRKRNYGIDVARESGFTHFIVADQDELYKPEEIEQDKKRMIECDLNGLVSGLRVYISKPTLYTTDHTLVATIQKLGPKTYVGNFREYPYAVDAAGKAHIDPSRRPSHTSKVVFSNTMMHHYSWVRKNIDLKIENSTANLKRSRDVIYEEIRNIKPGYISQLYHQPIYESENYFNIEL